MLCRAAAQLLAAIVSLNRHDNPHWQPYIISLLQQLTSTAHAQVVTASHHAAAQHRPEDCTTHADAADAGATPSFNNTPAPSATAVSALVDVVTCLAVTQPVSFQAGWEGDNLDMSSCGCVLVTQL